MIKKFLRITYSIGRFTTLCLIVAACTPSPADIVSSKCARANEMAAQSGDDAAAAGFMGSMIKDICKQAVQDCKSDPKGADCQKAMLVLQAAH